MVPVGPTRNEKASKINVTLGTTYYRQGNLELANEKLLKALRQDPQSSQAHHAYAVLQYRFRNKDKAMEHFDKAIELDPQNSEALNNYAVILCNEGRYADSVDMFMRAVENPAYATPEVAYTSGAVCLLKEDASKTEQAKDYLQKALAVRINYRLALINMAEILFDEKNYDVTKLYLQRFNNAGAQTARSLWLEIRNELELDNPARAYGLAAKLKADFPESSQYQSWLELSK
jgi:type IV pilus assembly protein PilF